MLGSAEAFLDGFGKGFRVFVVSFVRDMLVFLQFLCFLWLDILKLDEIY
jgi:hypothetical protein